jgi:hypothetical protein
MKQLIAKLNVSDGFGNKKVLKVFANRDEGTVNYSLTSNSSGIGFALSNMQCGRRGPSLPDNTYEYETNKKLLDSVVEAVNGGVYKIDDKKLFIED